MEEISQCQLTEIFTQNVMKTGIRPPSLCNS